MNASVFVLLSMLGGPLPRVGPDGALLPQGPVAELVDDGPGLLRGAVVARDPALTNPGRHGPVPTIDLNPAHTVFLSLPPDTAQVLRAGRVRVQLHASRTNSMEGRAFEDRGEGLFHAETSRTDFTAQLGLGHGLEVQLSVPWYDRYEPVMDEFIGWVERASWMREMMPVRQRYQGTPSNYELLLPEEGVVHSDSGSSGSGDTALALKGALWSEGRFMPGAAVRLAAKAPTGGWARGFGSGTFDAAAALHLQKSLLRWLTLYGTVTGTVPFRGSRFTRPFGMASLAVEAAVSRALSFVVQFNTASSPYHQTGIQMLDGRDDLWIAALNYTALLPQHRLRVSAYLVENAAVFQGEKWAGSANDFTVGLTVALETSEPHVAVAR